MNYAQLVAAICSYTENDFSTTEIDTIIKQAEQRIYNTVQFQSLRKNIMGVVTANNKYLSTPDDFMSVYSLAVVDLDGNYQYLQNRDVNFIREVYPNPNSTGLPKYYAIFGPKVVNFTITNELSLILGPTPDEDYQMEMHYFYYPESIVTSSTTWLGDNFDSVLLYGCLVEAYIFLKGEPDLIAVYDNKYKEALSLFKNLGDGKQRGDSYIDGQVTLPVQ